ncbi:50S ribosomal protein L28 [bacterium]|nr:50S ribosomal protein L28 [bacterium]
MAKKCEVTGKKPLTGYKVSHSQRHTKRRWLPNLRKVTVTDENGNRAQVKMSVKALRTMSKPVRIRKKQG